jgi:hypothetical protein
MESKASQPKKTRRRRKKKKKRRRGNLLIRNCVIGSFVGDS